MSLPRKARIVDVGPRDGLQNEATGVPTAVKIELIERLAEAGLPAVEATAFVSPKWVPQMSDSAQVMAGLRRKAGVAYPVLVPNLQGFEAARAAGAEEIAVLAPPPRRSAGRTSTAASRRASSASRPSSGPPGQPGCAFAVTFPAPRDVPTKAK